MFPQINQISSDLLRQYIQALNEKEAIFRTETLLKNKNTTSATAATAEALDVEANVTPRNLKSLIDESTATAVKNL